MEAFFGKLIGVCFAICVILVSYLCRAFCICVVSVSYLCRICVILLSLDVFSWALLLDLNWFLVPRLCRICVVGVLFVSYLRRSRSVCASLVSSSPRLVLGLSTRLLICLHGGMSAFHHVSLHVASPLTLRHHCRLFVATCRLGRACHAGYHPSSC